MTRTTCSTDGCSNKPDSRGMCKTHYNRWHKAGKPGASRWEKACTYCGTPMADPRRSQCGASKCKRQHTNAVAKAKRESRKARGLPQIRMAYQHGCAGCGETFASRDKNATHCSIQCFNRNKPAEDYIKAAATRAERSYPYECKVCGHQGISHYGRTLCENTICQYLGNNGRVSCPWYYKTCAWCDDPFTTDREAQIYCTTKCSESRKASMNGRKPRPYRRYAQLVYQRDNYICHLCGKHTLKAWDENNKAQSPTLDHIIPKSQGGPDTPNNLATACFECNVRRGVKDAEAYRRSLLTLV